MLRFPLIHSVFTPTSAPIFRFELLCDSILSKGHYYYTDFSIMDLRAWLGADVNNDGVVDSSDALAIQYKVHNGVFGN